MSNRKNIHTLLDSCREGDPEECAGLLKLLSKFTARELSREVASLGLTIQQQRKMAEMVERLRGRAPRTMLDYIGKSKRTARAISNDAAARLYYDCRMECNVPPTSFRVGHGLDLSTVHASRSEIIVPTQGIDIS